MQVFIGSSSEQVHLVHWLTAFMRKHYSGDLEPVPWTAYWQGGVYTLEHLDRIAEETDAAFLFFTADDKTWYREQERHEPRDNLVFESGLFFAEHDRRRVQILVPKYPSGDTRRVALPSDLNGLTVNYFQWTDKPPEYGDLPHIAKQACDAILAMGPRTRLPQTLTFLRDRGDIENVSALVGSFRTVLNDGIAKLAEATSAKEIDILVSYRVGDFHRSLNDYRKRAGGRLRVCFADMWDQDLLKIYQRKYTDRTQEHIQNALCDSVAGLVGASDFDIQDGKLHSVKPKVQPTIAYDVRLTSQRITYSLYRVDGTVFVVPLDMKTSQNPAPLAWMFAKETAPHTYKHYADEYELMFKESRCVFSS